MNNFEIGQRNKLFSLAEANELLPVIRSLTTQHKNKLAPVKARLSMVLANDPRRVFIENEYQQIVSRWINKVNLLGADVPDLWAVEFNVGEGALSWHYPETKLVYFRPQGASKSQRLRLQDYIRENDPDWCA